MTHVGSLENIPGTDGNTYMAECCIVGRFGQTCIEWSVWRKRGFARSNQLVFVDYELGWERLSFSPAPMSDADLEYLKGELRRLAERAHQSPPSEWLMMRAELEQRTREAIDALIAEEEGDLAAGLTVNQNFSSDRLAINR